LRYPPGWRKKGYFPLDQLIGSLKQFLKNLTHPGRNFSEAVAPGMVREKKALALR